MRPVVDLHAGLAGLITGRIDIPGQTDRYTFDLAQDTLLAFDGYFDNDQVTVTVTGPGGLGFTRNLRQDSELGGNTAFRAQAGTWTITVSAAGARTNAYAFRLIDLGAAPVVAYDTLVTGNLNPGDRTDTFRFQAAAGDRVYFDVRSWGKAHASDARWRLFDPLGRLVFGPNDFADVEVRTLDLAGTYHLVLEGRIYSPAPASYGFILHRRAGRRGDGQPRHQSTEPLDGGADRGRAAAHRRGCAGGAGRARHEPAGRPDDRGVGAPRPVRQHPGCRSSSRATR
jgi:hypothetical protein